MTGPHDMTRNPTARVEPRPDEEMLLDFHRSMRRSSYVLSSGEPSNEYADIDGYYLGGDGDLEFDRELAQQRGRRSRTDYGSAADVGTGIR